MKDLGPDLWTGIAKLKNVNNVAHGDDHTIIALGATTVVRNAKVGLDDKDWDDELFEDRYLIGI